MNMIKWQKNLIANTKKKAMPLLSFPCVALMECSIKDLISSSDLQAKGMKLVADRVNSLAAVSLMDLSVEAECFGAKTIIYDDDVPTIVGKLVNSLEEAEALKIPGVRSARAGIYIYAIKKAVSEIKDRPIFAGVIGAYSLAGRLVGAQEAMLYCYIEPQLLKIVLDKSADFLINYINEYKKAGANGVVIAEPLTGLLSPSLCEEFSEPYLKRIVDSVQDENFIVVYHNCGDTVIQIIKSIKRIGAKAYHFGNAIDMRDILPKMPSDVLVMGNIDPVDQFKDGTAKSIREETSKLLEDLEGYNNFVISSGCDIPPMANWDNIDSFFDAVGDYYRDK